MKLTKLQIARYKLYRYIFGTHVAAFVMGFYYIDKDIHI